MTSVDFAHEVACLREAIESADAIVVGAGAGLSTAAGLTYETVKRMVEEQRDMRVPTELVPHCPVCGKPTPMNLRADDTFVEDSGWHAAADRYREFLESHQKGKVLYLELGVGLNTPAIIKYPFWRYTAANPDATYACVNFGEAYAHESIRNRSITIDADIDLVLDELLDNGEE